MLEDDYDLSLQLSLVYSDDLGGLLFPLGHCQPHAEIVFPLSPPPVSGERAGAPLSSMTFSTQVSRFRGGREILLVPPRCQGS